MAGGAHLELSKEPASTARRAGFTLIELMIVLAVLAILTIVALPTYQSYITKSRRADAMIALQHVANEQEQFYFDNNRYSASLTSISVDSTSPDGHYTISLTSVSTTLFKARAVPVAGGSQAGSGRFEIQSTGAKGWDPGEDGVYECDWDDASRGSC